MKTPQAMMIAFAVLLRAQPSPAVDGEMILNGDFENHTYGTGCWSLPTAEFNSAVSNATSFGDGFAIGLMVGEVCAPAPPSGTTQLGIHKYYDLYQGRDVADAFSLDLSSPIVAGELYKIEFYAWPNLDDNYQIDIGQVEIGISTSPTSFGTLVFTGMPSPPEQGWTLFSSTFSAPIAANYLTVRAEYGGIGFRVITHIDNFSLIPAGPTSTDVNTWGKIKGLYR